MAIEAYQYPPHRAVHGWVRQTAVVTCHCGAELSGATIQEAMAKLIAHADEENEAR